MKIRKGRGGTRTTTTRQNREREDKAHKQPHERQTNRIRRLKLPAPQPLHVQTLKGVPDKPSILKVQGFNMEVYIRIYFKLSGRL